MTGLVILWVWGLIFVFAVVPGVIIGWLAAALLGRTAGTLISIATAGVASVVMIQKTFPGMDVMPYMIMYFPPFVTAALLGVWFSKLTSTAKQ
jgi:hypothetical protein